MATDREWLRECSFCYTRGHSSDYIVCEGCEAMVYCSKDCQEKDWGPVDGGDTFSNHQRWCEQMRGYMAKEEELSNFPFTFQAETTARSFHEYKAVDFLKRYGVYGEGLWRRESPLLHKVQSPKKCGFYTKQSEEKWVLPMESVILESQPATAPQLPSQSLLSWHSYYSFREFPLHSPIAIVLSCALTLYYILTSCLKDDEPYTFKKLSTSEPFVIHLLGVEKEVEMKEAFLELARLIPACKLHIIMIGKQISKAVDKYNWENENFHFTVCRSLYHKAKLPAPDLAVGFNAGLPAYPTWPLTLQELKKQNTPAYFTDQSEYSCSLSSSVVESLGVGKTSLPKVNPFRSPLRLVMREQNMPWFHNGFLFKLIYNNQES